MVELQPMETAPKGKWILVLDEHHTAFWQACWNKSADCFVWADGKMKLKRATGWIPMPTISYTQKP
jgi:hypothetical protein